MPNNLTRPLVLEMLPTTIFAVCFGEHLIDVPGCDQVQRDVQRLFADVHVGGGQRPEDIHQQLLHDLPVLLLQLLHQHSARSMACSDLAPPVARFGKWPWPKGPIAPRKRQHSTCAVRSLLLCPPPPPLSVSVPGPRPPLILEGSNRAHMHCTGFSCVAPFGKQPRPKSPADPRKRQQSTHAQLVIAEMEGKCPAANYRRRVGPCLPCHELHSFLKAGYAGSLTSSLSSTMSLTLLSDWLTSI